MARTLTNNSLRPHNSRLSRHSNNTDIQIMVSVIIVGIRRPAMAVCLCKESTATGEDESNEINEINIESL
jgi:hypothetical protein